MYGLYNIITLSAVKKNIAYNIIFQPTKLKIVGMIHQILSRGVYVSRYPRGAPWAMLCGIGMQEADMEKAQIGITSGWRPGSEED
jgi:hypothetical protein